MKTINRKSGSIQMPQDSDIRLESENAEPGCIKIHESVIASIVRKATCSVEGVARLAGSALIDNIAEIVGSKKIHDRAIAVQMDDGTVSIEVKINVSYGVHLPTVAIAVQEVVAKEVEEITGLKVRKVNVIIRELDDSAEPHE